MKILQHEDCRALNQGGAKSLDLEYNKTAWHGLKWSLGSRPLRQKKELNACSTPFFANVTL